MLRSQGLLAEMPDDWSHEDTEDPLYADFYKVEKWSRDGQRVAIDKLLPPLWSGGSIITLTWRGQL